MITRRVWVCPAESRLDTGQRARHFKQGQLRSQISLPALGLRRKPNKPNK